MQLIYAYPNAPYGVTNDSNNGTMYYVGPFNNSVDYILIKVKGDIVPYEVESRYFYFPKVILNTTLNSGGNV